VLATQTAGQPVISIDTKKKELIGSYKNGGSDYRQEGCPEHVKVHDFVDPDLGKVAPYGVYDVTANTGCVSLGISNDTAQFAVNSALAGSDGPRTLPGHEADDDHGGWRRLQRITRSPVQD
jgi:DDE family transposase